MMDTCVNVGGKDYLFRLSVRTLHLIEQKLGASISEIKSRGNLSLDHCLTITRYALRRIDTGEMLSDTEFEELIDSIDMNELNTMFPQAEAEGN